jgi:hypothetical protein
LQHSRRRLTPARTLQPKLDADDHAGALADFAAATAGWRNPWRNLFETSLNDYGYQLLAEKRLDDAILVFKLVTDLYAPSANAWGQPGRRPMPIAGIRPPCRVLLRPFTAAETRTNAPRRRPT